MQSENAKCKICAGLPFNYTSICWHLFELSLRVQQFTHLQKLSNITPLTLDNGFAVFGRGTQYVKASYQ